MTRIIERNWVGYEQTVMDMPGEISVPDLLSDLHAALKATPKEAHAAIKVSLRVNTFHDWEGGADAEVSLAIDTRRLETDREVRRRINNIDPKLPEYQKKPLRELRAMLKDGRALIAPRVSE